MGHDTLGEERFKPREGVAQRLRLFDERVDAFQLLTTDLLSEGGRAHSLSHGHVVEVAQDILQLFQDVERFLSQFSCLPALEEGSEEIARITQLLDLDPQPMAHLRLE